MKPLTIYKIFLSIIILTILTPVISMAQPAGPGDGGDPFATPVNGGVAFVAAIAFLYGAYRLYQQAKKNKAGNIDR
jgi:hypothetical protein